MLPIRDNHPLKRLFTGLVEHAFQTELGICDPALADYVSDLLIDFVRIDEMVIAREAVGKPVTEIAEMIANFESDRMAVDATRDPYVHRRIGDYTLFWTGVYPEGVGRSRSATWSDRVSEYVSFGKRSYAIASELTPPDVDPPPRLLRRLSEDFETCACGLGIVRHNLDHQRTDGDPGDLIY
ncbi:MAG: hypothetical protein R3E58_05895 [Phycisphaerae bacterium]|nr:hypothetical protein [Phycisphaerales bacterium]